MDYYARARELQNETVAHRRFFHENAEVGLVMPKAKKYVSTFLSGVGIDTLECGHGLVATVGRTNKGEELYTRMSFSEKGNVIKCILLRADMDALPMREDSGEEFASRYENAAHTCGHDLHVAMLLTAAKILKEDEENLRGIVKFMFQPAEETFEGARDMIECGVLENPKVDAALAFHVAAGKTPPGMCMFNSVGTSMCSADVFKIVIKGKGTHGAYPHKGVSPINVATRIAEAFQAIVAGEVDPKEVCTVSIGKLEAGSAANVIPDTAVIEGTVRAANNSVREFLVRRIKDVVGYIASEFNTTADFSVISSTPPLICDPHFTDMVVSYIREMQCIPTMETVTSTASEDFAYITERVPSAFMYLSAGFPNENGDAPAHNPKVRFNEDVLSMGAAAYAESAKHWLDDTVCKT